MNLKALLQRHGQMTQTRSNLNALFQELKDLVRPDTNDFIGGSNRAQDSRRRMYDGTAPWALDQLAGGLHSYNTDPNTRFFSLHTPNRPWDELSFESKLWLERRSDRIYSHYNDPFAALHPSLHEAYMDIGALGTGVLYQWYDTEALRLMFRTYPLADCWIDEGSDGRVNRLHRSIKWTVEQVNEEFGFVPPKMGKMKATDKVECIHAVYPNEQFDPKLRTATSRRYASVYFCKDTEEELSVGGMDFFPYHVPRWTKTAGDVYGRAPALAVISEIRMVNAMRRAVITAAQKMVDPALQVPDDGFLLPIRQTPGSVNLRRPGTEEIKPMPTPERIDIGVEMVEQSREMIRRGFFVDWIVRSTKKERQTAQEIMDDRNQMLSMMAPVTGRLQNELLGPMIQQSFMLLEKYEGGDPMPEELQSERLGITYLSPAARAQATVRGQGIQVFVDRLVQLQPVMPGITDIIDPTALASEMADITDVPRRILVSPGEAQAKAQAREQQQQMANAADMAPKAGAAAKDFALAQQSGLQLR